MPSFSNSPADWIDEFYHEFLARTESNHLPADLPELLREELIDTFNNRHTTKSQAFDKISSLVNRNVYDARRFVEIVQNELDNEVTTDNSQAIPTDIGVAKSTVKYCEMCLLDGIVALYSHKYPENRPVSAYCYCLVGKTTALLHRTKAPEVAKRFIDLSDNQYKRLRHIRYRNTKAYWEAYVRREKEESEKNNRPIDPLVARELDGKNQEILERPEPPQSDRERPIRAWRPGDPSPF